MSESKASASLPSAENLCSTVSGSGVQVATLISLEPPSVKDLTEALLEHRRLLFQLCKTPEDLKAALELSNPFAAQAEAERKKRKSGDGVVTQDDLDVDYITLHYDQYLLKWLDRVHKQLRDDPRASAPGWPGFGENEPGSSSITSGQFPRPGARGPRGRPVPKKEEIKILLKGENKDHKTDVIPPQIVQRAIHNVFADGSGLVVSMTEKTTPDAVADLIKREEDRRPLGFRFISRGQSGDYSSTVMLPTKTGSMTMMQLIELMGGSACRVEAVFDGKMQVAIEHPTPSRLGLQVTRLWIDPDTATVAQVANELEAKSGFRACEFVFYHKKGSVWMPVAEINVQDRELFCARWFKGCRIIVGEI